MEKEVLQKFKNGFDAQEIFQYFLQNGRTEKEIITVFEKIFNEKEDDFLNFLFPIEQFLKNKILREGETNFDQNLKNIREKIFWDPVGEVITENSFSGGKKDLKIELQNLKEDPKGLLKFFLLNFLVCAVGILLSYFLFFYHKAIDKGEVNWLFELRVIIPLFLFFSTFTVIPVLRHIFKIQKDAVRLLMAEKNGWQYSPGISFLRSSKVIEKFPQISISKGYLADEFFGTFPGNPPVDFWQANISYKAKYTNKKNRLRILRHRGEMFAIHLLKKIKTSFAITGESNFLKNEKDINLESAEFNRNFSVYYNGKKCDKENDIFSTLSPSVQLNLLEIKKLSGNFSLFFQDDIAFFIFSNNFFPKMKTNFFKKAGLYPSDQENFSQKVSNLLEICNEIAKFLD